jgi:hypothetical protein
MIMYFFIFLLLCVHKTIDNVSTQGREDAIKSTQGLAPKIHACTHYPSRYIHGTPITLANIYICKGVRQGTCFFKFYFLLCVPLANIYIGKGVQQGTCFLIFNFCCVYIKSSTMLVPKRERG